jgi:hypothetical protein
MCRHKHLRILATAATLATLSAPAAQAQTISDGGGGGPLINHHIAATSHHPAPTDWTLIALASGGAAVLAGVGLGASRRRTPTRQRRASHVA